MRACVFCETHMCPHAGVCVSVTTLGRIVVFALKVTQGGEKVRCGENNLERNRGNLSLAAPLRQWRRSRRSFDKLKLRVKPETPVSY